jgi:hypothetical protein
MVHTLEHKDGLVEIVENEKIKGFYMSRCQVIIKMNHIIFHV